jgi:hypothetical protein
MQVQSESRRENIPYWQLHVSMMKEGRRARLGDLVGARGIFSVNLAATRGPACKGLALFRMRYRPT